MTVRPFQRCDPVTPVLSFSHANRMFGTLYIHAFSIGLAPHQPTTLRLPAVTGRATFLAHLVLRVTAVRAGYRPARWAVL